MKYKGHKTITQNHMELYLRLSKAADSVHRFDSMSEEDKRKENQLREVAEDHYRKWQLFGNTFIMIL